MEGANGAPPQHPMSFSARSGSQDADIDESSSSRGFSIRRRSAKTAPSNGSGSPVQPPRQGSLQRMQAGNTNVAPSTPSNKRRRQRTISGEDTASLGDSASKNGGRGVSFKAREMTRTLTHDLSSYIWRSVEGKVLDRSKNLVWQDSTADVTTLQNQGVNLDWQTLLPVGRGAAE